MVLSEVVFIHVAILADDHLNFRRPAMISRWRAFVVELPIAFFVSFIVFAPTRSRPVDLLTTTGAVPLPWNEASVFSMKKTNEYVSCGIEICLEDLVCF